MQKMTKEELLNKSLKEYGFNEAIQYCLTDVVDPLYKDIQKLEQQNKALRELVDSCRGMQWARSSGECSQIWNKVEKELKEICGE